MAVKAENMMDNALEACELLKSIANPHRLVILCQLVDGEKSVGELAEFLGIRDSTASQNLSLMRKSGIVTARRDGQTMWYSIQSAEVQLILETLYGIYCSSHSLSAAKAKKSLRKKKASS
jgi:DNA-binding transcriptional ArsR family regulator